MRTTSIAWMLAFALACPVLSWAQVPNQNLANGIIAARKRDAAMLQHYTWNCRTEVTQDGNMQDLRIELVSLGPDGQPMRTLLQDQQGALHGGLFLRAAQKAERRDVEKYVKACASLLDQYTLSSAGKIIDFMSTAQIQPVTTPDGHTVLQLVGNNVVTLGDSLTMTVNGTTLRPTNLQISTTCEGDPVTVSATFIGAAPGPSHLQFATVQIPAKNLVVTAHNYDYMLAAPPPPPAQPVMTLPPGAGALPVGTTTTALPAGFQTLNVNGQTYYQSGPNWYRMEVGSNGIFYLVVQAP